MKIHTLAELHGMQADQTFRTPPWAALLFPVVSLAFCSLVVWALSNAPTPIDFWFACVSLALLVLFFVLFPVYVNFIPTLSSTTNWVLKVKGNRFYLNLRNYKNTHLPDDATVVVSFETSEIESIGQQVKRVSVPDRQWKEYYLEIRLKDKVSQEFITTLKSQPEWSDGGSMFHGWLQWQSRNAPTRVSYDDRLIRIMWIGYLDVGIWPSTKRTLVILGRIVPIHDANVIDRSQWKHLTDSQFDDRILELCQAGNRINAIKLLRERRNYSLTEATRFVDEISG